MRKTVFGLIFVLVLGALFVSCAITQVHAQINIDIYAGELQGGSVFGFGTSADNITSPGPTLNLMQGDTVTINFHNVGTVQHNFAIVSDKDDVNSVLWNATVQSGSNPVLPGSTAQVTFTVGDAGNYYYVCQVPGHAALGMWGNINNVIPEFSSVLALGLLLLAVTASMIYLLRPRKINADYKSD
jgi:plastocyanin